VQTHTLGKVDVLVYSGTNLPIFIEIGSYLTCRQGAKNKLAQLFF